MRGLLQNNLSNTTKRTPIVKQQQQKKSARKIRAVEDLETVVAAADHHGREWGEACGGRRTLSHCSGTVGRG